MQWGRGAVALAPAILTGLVRPTMQVLTKDEPSLWPQLNDQLKVGGVFIHRWGHACAPHPAAGRGRGGRARRLQLGGLLGGPAELQCSFWQGRRRGML